MTDKAPFPRPLSPHLQVYRPQLTSMMSILHRFTGVVLSVGTVMVIWGLVAAATGGEAAWNNFTAFCHTIVGMLMLCGWSFALYYHLCNGVRHLFWDTGHLFKIQNAYRAGYIVWLVSILLTGVTWWHVLSNRAPDAPPLRFVENVNRG